MIRKTFRSMICILFSIVVLTGCARSTATPLLPTETHTPPTLEPSPTASSINETPMIARVSIASDGTQGNGFSYAPDISADGRYVAFTSNASNLVEGDTNGGTDIFVHDRVTGNTQRVSVDSDGTQGTNNVDWITSSISADGHYIAFKSEAKNLVEGDPYGGNCYVHDRLTGETISVSVTSGVPEGGSDYVAPAISADGGYVVFDSSSTQGIFMYDRMTSETTLVPVSTDGTQGIIVGDVTSISADGRYIAFKSGADNLVEGDTNGIVDCFVHDRLTGETTRVSVASDGTQANGTCSFYVMALVFGPTISADGRYVAFNSGATNLVEGVTNGGVFVHDRVTEETTFVSVSSDGTQANGSSWLHAISADGRYVAFSSTATNLVEGVTDGYESLYLHDRLTGETRFVSISNYVINGDERFWGSSISADGRYIAFASSADNLMEGDTNGVSDIFVIDLWASK